MKRLAPGPATSGPLGSLLPYRRDPAQFLFQMQREYGDMVRLRLGPYIVHVVTNPAAVKRVLVDNNANYRRGKLYEQFCAVVGRGLLTTDGKQWREHRRAVSPTFARAAIDAMSGNVTDAADRMLHRWDEAHQSDRPVDLKGETLRVTLETLSSSLFGFDIEPSVPMLRKVVEESIEVMFPHGYLSEMTPRWIPIRRNRIIRRNTRLLDDLVSQVRVNHRRTGEGQLLALMEAARDPITGAPWSDQEIRDELLTIYLAGHETTASALCWALYAVATHTQVRRELEAEVDTVLRGRSPTARDVAQLPYTDAVVREALRMYPPIWLYPRAAVADDTLAGYHIPGGMPILLSPLLSHRNPEVWPNPEAFDPGRFLGPDPDSPPLSYLPFGAGARQCVGNHMALLELRLILAMAVQRFQFEVVPNLMRYGHSVISLRPDSEVLLRVKPRTTTRTTEVNGVRT